MSYNPPDDPRAYSRNPQSAPGGYAPDNAAAYGSRPLSTNGNAAPPKGHGLRNGLIIGGIVVVLLLVLSGVVYTVGTSQAAKPVQVANNFCTDLKAQNYSGAYALFSPAYKASVSAAQYELLSQLRDQVDGKIKDCSLSPTSTFSLDFGATSQTLSANVTRNKTFSGTLGLVKQGDTWAVNSIEDSLQGTDVGPIAVAQQFCAALVAKKYDDAYADFSAKRQAAIGTKTDYANSMKAAFGTSGVSLSGCQSQLNTYSIGSSDSSASITITLQVKVSTPSGSSSQAVPLQVAFVKDQGQWKIDDAEVAG